MIEVRRIGTWTVAACHIRSSMGSLCQRLTLLLPSHSSDSRRHSPPLNTTQPTMRMAFLGCGGSRATKRKPVSAASHAERYRRGPASRGRMNGGFRQSSLSGDDFGLRISPSTRGTRAETIAPKAESYGTSLGWVVAISSHHLCSDTFYPQEEAAAGGQNISGILFP